MEQLLKTPKVNQSMKFIDINVSAKENIPKII